jgi:hypothetical protein
VVRRPCRVIHVRQAAQAVVQVGRHDAVAACQGGPVAVLVVAVGRRQGAAHADLEVGS